MFQRNCIKFRVKNEIKCARTRNVDCGIWRIDYEQHTNSIVGLRKAEKMSMTTDKNVEAIKKIIFDNSRITIR